MNKLFFILLMGIFMSSFLFALDESEKVMKTEISEDGHQIFRYSSGKIIDENSFTTRDIPYNLTPDWQNNFRVQVGALQVYDVDNDGYNDVIVGCYHSDSYPPYDDWHNYIYFNQGTALEANPSWTSSDEVSTGDIQVADINDDGFPDIFAANGGYSMDPSVIYYGSLTGPSTAPGWYSNESGGAWNNYALLIDIDHDEDIDVITANQGNSTYDPYRPMYMFMNNSGALNTTPSWQSAETSIQNFLAAADMDHDGWEDIAVSKWANFESGVYKNNSGSLATSPMWTTGDYDTDKGIGWADVNNDGWDDLALGHDPTELFNNNMGTLSLSWISTYTYFGQQDLRFCDVDCDGDKDLAEIHFSNGVVNIYMNDNGALQDVPSWSYDCSSVGTAIAFGDINGNGSPDLVVGNSGNPSIMVFYNQNSVSVDNEPQTNTFIENYPNPFTHSTTISFSKMQNNPTEIKIYNLKGELVSQIPVSIGQKSVTWNGMSNNDEKVPSGIYLYQLQKGNKILSVNRCLLLR
ncbi:MAG: T9SS type A sorting domain-containing protein [Candidatus Cloacimonetes bacterium]|nr:T9SS type A sorting domain-containing protein [Candidatus Cloacimonadota bacterium]